MPDALALTQRAQARRAGAAYLLVVFALIALASAAVLPEWVSSPAPAASAPGGRTVAAAADDVTGLVAAAEVWLEGFAAEDAAQMASAAGDVTRRAERLSLSLRAIQEAPRTRTAGSAGHLGAALAYLEAGVASTDPVAVARGRDLLRLAQPARS